MSALLKLARAAALAAALAGLASPADAQSVSSRIYPAPTEPLSLAGLPSGTRLVEVSTADGLRLRGLVAPGRADRPLLLVLHGNGSSAASALRWLAPLVANGYGIVAAEYRGYSGNAGKPSEAGLAVDAAAFLALARQEAGGREVWTVGHSLGGGVALSLARRETLAAVITIGAFTRLRDMAPGLARALVPNEYRNSEAVAGLDEPLYVVHGLQDATVPWQHGEKLHNRASAAKREGASFAIRSAGHQPAASDLLAILDVISEHRRSGRWNAGRLSETVLLIPFGTSRPLDRPPARPQRG